MMNWLKENWFRVALLVLLAWLILGLQDGIKVRNVGEVDLQLRHSGYIEDDSTPYGLPSLR